MGNLNWPHLLFLLIVIGFSFISWVFKQLQQQNEARRREASRQRQGQGSRRTGRDISEVPDPAVTAAQDAAARRQAQLQELRRRREQALQARPGGGGAGSSTPATLSRPASTASTPAA